MKCGGMETGMAGLFGRKPDKTPDMVFFTRDTKYGRYVIRNGLYKGEEARLYEVDDVRESASFFDDKKYELVFDYTKKFELLFEGMPEKTRILMIGGGGFQYPKYIISHFPLRTMDVVEINPLSVRLARKYFFLNDMERVFKAESTGRLRIIIDDGIHFLEETDDKYDVIINDAYHGGAMDEGLASSYGFSLISAHLSPGGVFGFNLITTLKGEGSMPFFITEEMLGFHFSDVEHVRCTPDIAPEYEQNVIFIARNE